MLESNINLHSNVVNSHGGNQESSQINLQELQAIQQIEANYPDTLSKRSIDQSNNNDKPSQFKLKFDEIQKQ